MSDIEKILRTAPLLVAANVQRLANAIHSEGFTLVEARLTTKGDPEITIAIGPGNREDGLGGLFAGWGYLGDLEAKAGDGSFLVELNEDMITGVVRLIGYTDADFASLPPLPADFTE